MCLVCPVCLCGCLCVSECLCHVYLCVCLCLSLCLSLPVSLCLCLSLCLCVCLCVRVCRVCLSVRVCLGSCLSVSDGVCLYVCVSDSTAMQATVASTEGHNLGQPPLVETKAHRCERPGSLLIWLVPENLLVCRCQIRRCKSIHGPMPRPTSIQSSRRATMPACWTYASLNMAANFRNRVDLQRRRKPCCQPASQTVQSSSSQDEDKGQKRCWNANLPDQFHDNCNRSFLKKQHCPLPDQPVESTESM